MVHWNGQTYRYQANDFELATRTPSAMAKARARSGCDNPRLGRDLQGDLEPHFDRFEYLLGTSGNAGNVRGEIRPGGDPFNRPVRENIQPRR